MMIRHGRYGEFTSCSGYPECKYVKQNFIGVKCPECKDGELVEKRARKGNTFYGCGNYPKCKFTSAHKPIAEKCPSCGSEYLVEKNLKAGPVIACPNKECDYERARASAAEAAASASASSENGVSDRGAEVHRKKCLEDRDILILAFAAALSNASRFILNSQEKKSWPRNRPLADAQLILQLYDFGAKPRCARPATGGRGIFPAKRRRLPEGRLGDGHARKQLAAPGGRLLGYGGVIRSISGVLNEELFLQPGFSGEMFLIYAKIHPFMKELARKLNDPQAFANIEKAVTRTKWGRDRLQFMIKRVETMREKRKCHVLALARSPDLGACD